MSCENCGCENCRDVFGDDETSDFECHACGEDLNDEGHCPNEDCEYFECDPFVDGGSWTDDVKWERRQMGITS